MTTNKPVYYPSGKVLSEFQENRQIIHDLKGNRTEWFLHENGRHTGEYNKFDKTNFLTRIKRFDSSKNRTGYIKEQIYGPQGGFSYFQLSANLEKETIRNERGNVICVCEKNPHDNTTSKATSYFQSGRTKSISYLKSALPHGYATYLRDNDSNQKAGSYIYENGFLLSEKIYTPENILALEYDWLDESAGYYIKTEHGPLNKVISEYQSHSIKTRHIYSIDDTLLEARNYNKQKQCLSVSIPVKSNDAYIYKQLIVGKSWDETGNMLSADSLFYRNDMQVKHSSLLFENKECLYNGEVIALDEKNPGFGFVRKYIKDILIEEKTCPVFIDEATDMLSAFEDENIIFGSGFYKSNPDQSPNMN